MHSYVKRSLFILPNMITLSSVFCGFYAMVIATQPAAGPEKFHQASLLITFAMFFDAIDGRVARLTRTQSAFGVQIDSLADLLSFGAAPALLAYRWSLAPLGNLGLAAAFAFLACGAIRLARFNVLAVGDSGAPKTPGKYTLGLPIPGAAGLLVSLVAADHAVDGAIGSSPQLVLCVMLALGLLMVSSIRFRSFKELRIRFRTLLPLSVAVGSSVFLAIRMHIAFAIAWLLLSYVALALVEATLSLTTRLLKRRQNLDEEDSGFAEP